MSNRSDIIGEMLLGGGERLQAQQSLAIAAGARAIQLASICAAIVALGLTFSVEGATWVYLPPVGLILIAAVMFFLSARPSNWCAPGMRPSYFEESLAAGVDIEEVRIELARLMEQLIVENRRIVGENEKKFRIGVWCAATAPIVAVISYGVRYLL